MKITAAATTWLEDDMYIVTESHQYKELVLHTTRAPHDTTCTAARSHYKKAIRMTKRLEYFWSQPLGLTRGKQSAHVISYAWH